MTKIKQSNLSSNAWDNDWERASHRNITYFQTQPNDYFVKCGSRGKLGSLVLEIIAE
ncbi:MAG: hypothetical protein GY816_23845 [Cytophagales bacterium]|nr:hypothetical protein [Cytophagales bacterium]